MAGRAAVVEEERDEVESLKPDLPTGVKRLATDKAVTEEDVRSATEWFAEQAEVDSPVVLSHTITKLVNFGGIDGEPEVIRKWTVTSVDPDESLAIRKQVIALSRRGKRPGTVPLPEDIDNDEFNARIVVAGSIDPNFWELAKLPKYAQFDGPDKYTAPVKALKWGTRHKPGLIEQMSGVINAMSGYDDNDVRDMQKAGKG